jgi:hypothetical protein
MLSNSQTMRSIARRGQSDRKFRRDTREELSTSAVTLRSMPAAFTPLRKIPRWPPHSPSRKIPRWPPHSPSPTNCKTPKSHSTTGSKQGSPHATLNDKQWTGIDSRTLVNSALDKLEGCGWIRSRESGTTSNGGRPTRRYEINPAIREKRRQNEQKEGFVRNPTCENIL